MPLDTSQLIATCEPFVWLEEVREGYWRYVDATTGQRWEVFGICDQRGDCWEGAVGPKPTLDCPVRPGFTGCCPLTFVELAPAEID